MTDRLFHGTNATIAVGNLIQPRMKGKGFGDGGAYATEAMVTARCFGPIVYEVEVLPGDEPVRRRMSNDNGEGHIEVVSAVGYRVVGVVDDDVVWDELTDLGYRSCDGCDVIDPGGEEWEHGVCPTCVEGGWTDIVAA